MLHSSSLSTKHPDSRWEEEVSAPEISVVALGPGYAEAAKGEDIVGERFGKYLLIGEIAAGGMAELFLAVHKGIEGVIKVVVIKRVLPHFGHHEAFVGMFIDEARLAARLDHPNIVRTYEFGEVDGQHFTAMEYLAGEDLCKVLNKLSFSRQLMPISMAVEIAAQVCTGLHFAHQLTDTDGNPLNLVHRDVNPANIVITYRGEVKIIDFGVAKSNASRQTVTGTIKGKVAYMPPEQVLGRPADQRADTFSAGVVLWEMLTGRPLFLRDNEAASLYAIMKAPIPPPSKFRSDVPPQLDRILGRALSRSPAERYGSAEEMAAALEDFLLELPRCDARVLARLMEDLFGTTCAEAKRSIAQTRSLSRNISLVMKLRSDVRVDLAEHLDAAVQADNAEDTTLPHPRVEPDDAEAALPDPEITAAQAPLSPRWLVFALIFIMIGFLAAGAVSLIRRAPPAPAVKPLAAAAVQIESTPPGAAVFIAGEPTGLKTPTMLTGITARQLVIRLELPGHVPVTENLDVAPGTTLYKNIALAASPARLVISGVPAGAGVFVDDREHLAGAAIVVAPGRHAVRIVVDGKTVTQQAIDAGSGDQAWKLVRGRLIPD
ncbi:MAG: PEGA domain-containing protein [Deltaproteobacteria bacterium]|nr:MAG: PEGA domain-containing protein [Deltaproteobacteria bacterium]TMQ28675.1 MAG: PEGA domain-containing protein [Deltaproteobacteria bacterium]